MKNRYLLGLTLPILFPGLVLIITGLNDISGFFIASILIGGIPYIIFILSVVYWSKNKSFEEVRSFSKIAPVIFTIILIICVFLFYGYDDIVRYKFNEFMRAVSIFSFWGLIVGYAYVFIFNAIFKRLNHL